MRPTSEELLGAIEVALTTRVAPAVEDPVVLSELRSTIALIRHLRVRVAAEVSLLVAEAADLTSVLRAGGVAVDDPPSLDGGDVAALAMHVEELRGRLDAEVVRAGAAGAAGDSARLAEIDAYLARHASRRRPLLADPFSRGWS